jgi:hypothetical protein
MCEQNKEKPENHKASSAMDTGDLPKQTEKEAQAEFHSQPSAKPSNEIHPRQFIPPVPNGADIPDDTPSPPVELD